MKKLDLYLNDSQYEKLCILAEEKGMGDEEFANESFYEWLFVKWCNHQNKEYERMLNDPNTDWED